jgi:hypothetical protein
MTRKILAVVGRCLLATLGAFVGLMLGSLLNRVLALPLPALPFGANSTQLLFLDLVGTFLICLLLFPLASRLRVPTSERTVVLFLVLWGIRGPLQASEAYFFTTYGGTGSQLISTAASNLALAMLLAALFPPRVVDRRLLSELRARFVMRPVSSWLWRILLAGTLYLPAYWIFGMLAYSVTHAYYENSSLGLGLRVPPVEVIVPLEIGRGLLVVLVLLPLVSLLGKERWSLVGWLWLVIALLAGWEPLLTATFLPEVVRLVHGVEITADALAQALTIAGLVGATVKMTPSQPIAEVGRAEEVSVAGND